MVLLISVLKGINKERKGKKEGRKNKDWKDRRKGLERKHGRGFKNH